MLKKVIGCAVAILLVLAVVKNPAGAATTTRHVAASFGKGVLAFGDYLAGLISSH